MMKQNLIKGFVGILIISIAVAVFFVFRYHIENERLIDALAKANANIEGANDVIRDAKSWGIGRTDEEGRALNGLEELETIPTPQT
jgi:hypothetical protein